MVRQIIKINQELCNGCELCVKACHEGAIGMEKGKAVLLRDDYCDGLGDCLPACPTNAISFEQREALAYDEVAVLENMKKAEKPQLTGCPGSMARELNSTTNNTNSNTKIESELTTWPVQLQLVAPNAEFFNNADVVLAADCCAYAYGNFHQDFMKNKVTIIGCPKLDDADYYNKLLTILQNNNIKSFTVTRMEVPCCGGLAMVAVKAFEDCGKNIDMQVVTISISGRVLKTEKVNN